MIDAIKAVDPIVDFSQYAVNGEVPNLFVIHAGPGAEFSGCPAVIWSHHHLLSVGSGLDGYWADGVRINEYIMLPESGGDLTGYMFGVPLGPYPPTVGVCDMSSGTCWDCPINTITATSRMVAATTASWAVAAGASGTRAPVFPTL